MANQESEFLEFLKIRDQFPILKESIYGHPLIYLDNAATTQKPLCVVNSTVDYYTKYNSNVHRGTHFLSDSATLGVESTRQCVQKFINAKSSSEIVFTKGATESINLVAHSYGKKFLKEGDEVIISAMEHHSNIMPWQVICKEQKAKLHVAPICDNGELDIVEFSKLLSPNTKIVSICHVSNVLGTINPVKNIVALAKCYGAVVLLDSAQALAHVPIDVQDIDCDFLVASSHKAYGPTGIGILYAKEKHLECMDPYQTGGGMVSKFTFEASSLSDVPFKFEAGTPNIAGICAFQAALNFISEVGFSYIQSHESKLKDFLLAELSKIEGISILGASSSRVAIVSFFIKTIHPLDIGVLLDAKGIAVRTGNLCCQPIMDFFKVPGAIRISCGIYNMEEEILQLLNYIRIMLLKRVK